MGGLLRGNGNEWRYVFDDFSGGWYLPGSFLYPLSEASEPKNSGATVLCYESWAGELSVVVGDTKFNATSFTGTGDINLIFPYMLPSSAGTYLELFARGTTLYSSLAGAAAVTEGGLGATTATRYAAQALGYCWIARSNGQMFRFNKNNPGGGITVSNAGTKSPTNAPTLGAPFGSGASLTSGTGYRYRYAWEYGTGRELGMGWKQGAASSIVTPTGTQFITVTMDTDPPTSWSHAVSRALFRNTTFFQNNFFLVTRTAYTGTSLANKYEDGIADSLIENGEETDPPTPQDPLSNPLYSELLPVTFTFPTIHENRLWGLDCWTSSTRYPSRAVYSRVTPVGPAPRWDQFDTFATVEAAPSDLGAPNGLISWMGNLYALFERGITVLSTDPGVARLPTFATVVAGRGAVSPQATAATPFGIVMMSAEGPILFDGGPSPLLLSEAISGDLRSKLLTSTVGGYDPFYQKYSFVVGSGSTSKVYTYNFNTKQWNDELDTAHMNLPWSYAMGVGGELHYALVTGTTTAGNADFIYRRSKGSINTSMTSAKSLKRQYTIWASNLGKPFVVKRLRWILVHFQQICGFNSSSSILFTTLRNDDATDTVTTSFPSTSSRTFRFGFSGNKFISMALNITISQDETAGTTAEPSGEARIMAIEVVYDAEDERVYSKAVA